MNSVTVWRRLFSIAFCIVNHHSEYLKMGLSKSKLQVRIPSPPSCFPSFEEDLEVHEASSRLTECHTQAVQMASWITTAFCPSYTGHFGVSVATYLLAFMMHRLSTRTDSTPKTSTPKSRSRMNPQKRRSRDEDGNKVMLEGALIDAKVNAAIAKRSVCELRAKIHVIKNRYKRLLSEIHRAEKLLEIVPTIHACEEVLQLFADSEHVFRANPLVSAPFLAAFAGVFVTVAEICLGLLPSYREHLIEEMKLMTDTVIAYKESCIQTRIKVIKFKSVQPGSMLDAVSTSFSEHYYQMEDSFAPRPPPRSSNPVDDPDSVHSRTFHDANEALATYKAEIEEKYTSFFGPVLSVLADFPQYCESKQVDDDGDDDDSGTITNGKKGNESGNTSSSSADNQQEDDNEEEWEEEEDSESS